MTPTPPSTGTAAATPAATGEPPGVPARSSASKWWILVVVALAQVMVVLDATIVNIALPTAQQSIGFSNDDRQWVVTAYALAFGSLLLVGGRLGDMLGRKPVFAVGLVGFATASAVGGAASTFEVLVAARAGQGVFGALLAPAALSILSTTFAERAERSRAFAIFGAISGAGGAVGLVLGGALTEYLSWRWCLYVNVGLAVVALVGAVILLPRTMSDRGAARLDVPGALLSVTGLVAVVYGLANAETDGWESANTWGFIAAGVVVLGLFAMVESRVEDPLLPLAVLLDRNRGGAFLAVAIVGAGTFGVFLFLTYYMATIQAYDPLATGLAFLPMVGGVLLSAQLVPAVLARVGARLPVTVGFVVATLGMLYLTQLELDSSYTVGVLPGLIVVGLGIGWVLAPGLNAATDRVDPGHAGVASAAVNTFQQIGGSIGTAVFSAVAASAASDYLIGKNPKDPGVLAQSALESYTAAFFWSAVVFAIGAVVSAVLLRHGALVRDPDAEPVIGH